MLNTVTDNLETTANRIQGLLTDLLVNHSVIYKWNIDDPEGLVITISSHGDYAYKELQEGGRHLQVKLLEEYRRFHAILTSLLQGQPQDTIQALAESDEVLRRTIEQQETWCRTIQEALEKVVEALQLQVSLLKRLYDASNGEVSYIPDTNALLYNPTLEHWSFSESPKFSIILLPTVLSELDSLKINHRNEVVRDKADKLIHQIKEYRRRGKLTEGVPIVGDKISLFALAVEPRKEFLLPWLDPDNNDDRLLAGSIEVMRLRPRSPVIIVSRDINLQNKAEFAQVPFVEPPEPI